MTKPLVSFISAALLSAIALDSFAATISVKITNLTQAIYFTPLLITAHGSDTKLFRVGESASPELQAMAEGGDLSGLVSSLEPVGASSVINPAEGLLAPASSVMTMSIDTGVNDLLSITAMILPSNDGFVGVDSWPVPAEAGTYTLFLNAYDAGTEANNELILDGSGAPGMLGIPANPGADSGSNGTGVTTSEANDRVHIHRGTLGDSDLNGGVSDLTSNIHRWLNPVAKLLVTVE
ncbi:spondin domain-containing protein [Teredinibacter waterburyi]|uniref:spondin domain-containing protein n=1 Tax=Teredinibacter waterburyi TaxID=1500538 RepID=UPI00165EFE2F|nr:spondin domain-containing protein [Teredinibacter waterburyi]